MEQQRKFKNLVPAVLNGELSKERPLPILSYYNSDKNLRINILTPNDITLFFGETSCGKSKIGAFLIKQLLLKKTESNFKRFQNKKPYKVIVVDTEMTKENVRRYFMDDNFYEYESINVAGDELLFKDCYEIYSINENSIDECNEALMLFAKEQEQYLKDFNIVFFIDNLGSFVEDLNSSSNNGWVKQFRATFSLYTVLCVMHSNIKETSSNKKNATGSLGSAIEKIVANRFQVDKMEEGATITLLKSKTQNDRESPKLPFLITETENALIVNVSDMPLTSKKNDKSTKKVPDNELQIMLLEHLNTLPLDSDLRTRTNITNEFANVYSTGSWGNKLTQFINEGILIAKEKGRLYHIDENPF